MRCKKHLMDQSSTVGVCATCLRERLITIIAAQEKAQAQGDGGPAQKPETKPPPLLFPRSVSPYLSHRKSDTTTLHHHGYHIRSYHSLPDPKFFSTPQLGPNGTIIIEQRKKKSKFGLFSKMFGSKSDKPVADLAPKVYESRIPGHKVSVPRDSSSTSSHAWFPNFLSRKKQTRTFSVDEVAIRRLRRDHRDRGMSPVMDSDDDEVDSEHCCPEPSGYNSDEWRHTPRRTPIPAVGRRCGGAAAGGRSTNVSGISFCLSPMVRASPSQSWSYKGGVPPDMVVSGEIRMPIKSHSITASFCKNRSRKLADIGRSSRNR